MFRAFGAVLVLWFLSAVFSESVRALDGALTASFQAMEAAAVASRENAER